jgi:hypothetical protein
VHSQSTAHSAVLTPSAPPPPWPAPTVALCDRANQAVIRACAEHAEFIRKRDELMHEYVEQLTSGVWLTATPAQDRAADIVHLERLLRTIERSLIGEEARCGR